MANKMEIPVEVMERMATTLKVLAHPHRLKIVEFLEREKEAPVSAIQLCLKVPQSVASQHLGHMKRVGLLESVRRGKEVWYRIADRRSLTILNCIRKKHGEV